MIRQLRVQTKAKTELVDITRRVIQSLVTESGVRSGICYVYVPHTTSGITINENTDPNVGRDILKELNKRLHRGGAQPHRVCLPPPP